MRQGGGRSRRRLEPESLRALGLKPSLKASEEHVKAVVGCSARAFPGGRTLQLDSHVLSATRPSSALQSVEWIINICMTQHEAISGDVREAHMD